MTGLTMPTVMIDCRYLTAGGPSGIGAVLRSLIAHLPALAPDWHFRLLRHHGDGTPLSDAGNVSDLPVAAPANGPATMWWLPRLVDFSTVDLFHAPSNILPRAVPVPCVTTVHDLMWLTDPDLCNPRPWGRIERHFYRHGIARALRQSAALVTVSEATRAAIGAAFPAALARTTTVLSGVPDGFGPTGPADDNALPATLTGQPYVLCVGQSAPYKNHSGALRGFAMASARHPDLHLVLVQRRGHGTAGLQQLARDLGVERRVHFLPAVAQPRLAALYRSASALLHPSLCEGFGVPLAEAMASGCPVITSDRSAMPEVTGGAALLVDPADPAAIGAAIVSVLERPDLAARMKADGLARARQLDGRAAAAGYLEVYRRVLGQSV